VIRAVIFDIGGVMAHLDDRALLATWPSLGVDRQGLYDAMYAGNDATALIGRVSAEVWWRGTVASRLRIDDHQLERFLSDLGSNWHWDEQLLAVLRSFTGRYRTAFLTNAWSDMRELMRARGVLDAAEVLINSAEVGVAKPEERIFRIALEQLQVEPSEALFVDDVEANAMAARTLGMTAILHRSTQETLRRLDDVLS
jgi:putative hydrolase of the HAD superfamily